MPFYAAFQGISGHHAAADNAHCASRPPHNVGGHSVAILAMGIAPRISELP